MRVGESTLEGCNRFKEKLANLEGQYENADSLVSWLDTVTCALAEKLLEGFRFEFYIDPSLIAESHLSEEHRVQFLQHEASDSVDVIHGIGVVGKASLNQKGVGTCAQLFGKALLMATPDAEKRAMSLMKFYEEFIKDNVASAYKKKVIHQIGERFCEPVGIAYQ